MAGRYVGLFYSQDTGDSYLVAIGDTAYAGLVEAVTIVDFEITYDPDTQDRFTPIIGSKLSIKILINSAGLETLATDMFAAEEGRFTVNVVRNFTTILFPFYVLMDLVEIEDSPHDDGVGYVFDIQCTDCIGRLKSIDYNDAGTPYSGYETFTDHIFNCLNKLPGLTALYSSAYLLKVICNWREDSRTYSASENPLDYARINHEAFYTIDNNGLYVYKSCYAVLKEIAQSWGARFMFSETSFWFIQVNELVNAASCTIYGYSKTKVLTVLSSQDITVQHDQADPAGTGIVKQRGGRFGFHPPLNRVTIDYDHRTDKNLIAGAVWPGSGTVTAIGIDYNAGVAKLAYKGRLNYATDPSAPTPSFFPLYLVFQIMLKVGSQYFTREITSWPGGGPEYGPAEWSGSIGYWNIAVFIHSPGDNAVIFPSFVTTVLPASGDLDFLVDFLDAYTPTGSVIGGSIGTLEWELDDNYLELLVNGNVAEQTKFRRFINTNDTDGNSYEITLPATIGDGPTITSPGHVEVYSDVSTWVLASQWRVGNSGTYKDRNRLLANEIIRGQLVPVKKEFGTFFNVQSVYFAHNVIKRGSDLFIFQSGSIKLGADTTSGEWWNLSLLTSGWTEEALIQTNSGTSSPSTGGAPSGIGAGGTGGVVTIQTKFYKESFTGGDFSANAFTVTVNGGTLPLNAAQILVFYNGVYTDEWSHTGSVITMSFQIYFSDIIVIQFFVNA